MLNQLRKDANSIFCRILDHRVFVNGEIERVLSNFETLREDKEVETLLKVAQTTTELRSEIIEKCFKQANSNLPTISKALHDCMQKVENFIDESSKTNSQKFLEKSRRSRQERKQLFCQELEDKYARVHNTFEAKEEEINDIYSDLQLKLNIKN